MADLTATTTGLAPFSYYRLNETSGTVATDAIGHSNGTYSGGVTLGSTPVTANDLGSPTFNGTTGKVATNLSASDAGLTGVSFSVSVFVNFAALAAFQRLIASTNETTAGWEIFPTSTGFTAAVRTAAGAQTNIAGTTTLATNTIYHLALVYDNAATLITLYVNGASNATATYIAPGGSTFSPSIGCMPDNTNFAAARISEASFYNKALTAAQVLSLYSARSVASGATLSSIALTPQSPTVVQTQVLQFKAVGTYSDASTQDLTSTATWSVGNANGTITAAGLYTAATLSGTCVVTVTSGAITNTSTVTNAAPAIPGKFQSLPAHYSREFISSYAAGAADTGGTGSQGFRIPFNCTRVRLVYSNYIIPTPNESLTCSAVTVASASIQTTPDSGTPVAFSIVQGTALTPGQVLSTEWLTIPAGLVAGQFVQIRTYGQWTASTTVAVGPGYSSISATVTGYTGTGGDNYVGHATGAGTNQTLTAGAASLWTSTANSSFFGPLSLECLPSDGQLRPLVGLVGDSIMQGANDANDSTGGAAVRAMVAAGIPYFNAGLNGEKLGQLYGGGNAYSMRLRRLLNCTAIIEHYGTNDLTIVSDTAVNMKKYKLSFWQLLARNGAIIIPVTLLPRPSGTTTPAASQTVNANLAAYQAVNAWLRAPFSAGAGNSAQFDAALVGVNIPFVIDAASYIETTSTNTVPGGPSAPATAGRWYCGAGNATAYSTDLVHPETIAMPLLAPAYNASVPYILASAPVMATAVASHFIRRF